ncbi:hypothetical protein Rsub_08097 [Raphidocelis subcapitata]|uniref:GST N-terminal domain-containing protein n=1 Tax=Raphidocelis subcapitata TaxID=307507 RepID=A0A2V0P7X4_9CHLO|nr:hypothetical protein Rsub_08097 [Raphidocelis subcapitata]|eukprot:GBF95974.1 hypothetical protein Rsub_08097 [Raphidocelis subcapitata]
MAAAPADVPARGDPADPVRLVLLPAKIGTAVNASPFSTKLLAFVRISGVEHELVKADITSNSNPRKLWPYMLHGPNVVPDSSAIASYLAATYPETAGRMFPSDPKSLGLAHAAARMMDEATFPILLWYRFMEPANRVHMENSYFGRMPWLVRRMVMRRVVPRTEQRLYLQGVGRLSEPDLLKQLKADFAALSSLLGAGPYLLGASPCFADATLFGFLDTAIHDAAPNPCVKDAVLAHPNLVEFARRVRAEYFSDFPPGGGFPGVAAAAAGAAAAE